MAVIYKLVLWLDDSNPGTAVVIALEFHPNDFKRYMLLVQYLKEDVMDKLNLTKNVQLVPFHPRFLFNWSGIDRINNHMKHSPYPMFHVLREDELLATMDKLNGNTSRVWRRNVNLLGRMDGRYGREGTVQAMEGGWGEGKAPLEGMDKLLREARSDQLTSPICNGD